MTDRVLSRTSNRTFVAWVVAVMLAIRLSYLVGPLASDEAGYLLVARNWHLGGPNLYGHYFVDRPPLLIFVFKIASLLSWDDVIRVLALPFAVLIVLAAAWAVDGVVGGRGARWAAVVAAVLVTNPLLGAPEADGELFAAPLVMLSVALVLVGVRRSSVAMAFAAGVSAGGALMLKQNFYDGFVFGAVLLAVSLVQGRLARRTAVRLAVAGAAGGGVVLLGLIGYIVWARVGVFSAYFQLFGMRGSALDVITDHDLHATGMRGLELLILAVVSGALPLLAVLVRNAWRTGLVGTPIAWAISFTTVLGLVSMLAGGSYWPHYLIQLAPMLALAVGLWASHDGALRVVTVYAVLASLVATVSYGVDNLNASPPVGERIGLWLAASGQGGDTASVLYGHAEIQLSSGMPSPSEHLWSLPLRTTDPHETKLRALLAGPRAPTWLVDWSGVNSWDIDPHDATTLTIATHYRLVAHVCGVPVWLHDGVRRSLAPRRACAGS
ncbi:MAG: hypothetical protein ACRDPI_04850 [Nocardioidaceae bacterium]